MGPSSFVSQKNTTQVWHVPTCPRVSSIRARCAGMPPPRCPRCAVTFAPSTRTKSALVPTRRTRGGPIHFSASYGRFWQFCFPLCDISSRKGVKAILYPIMSYHWWKRGFRQPCFLPFLKPNSTNQSLHVTPHICNNTRVWNIRATIVSTRPRKSPRCAATSERSTWCRVTGTVSIRRTAAGPTRSPCPTNTEKSGFIATNFFGFLTFFEIKIHDV